LQRALERLRERLDAAPRPATRARGCCPARVVRDLAPRALPWRELTAPATKTLLGAIGK
jgi:hypothetical protein